jgi:hypothetical protein
MGVLRKDFSNLIGPDAGQSRKALCVIPAKAGIQ